MNVLLIKKACVVCGAEFIGIEWIIMFRPIFRYCYDKPWLLEIGVCCNCFSKKHLDFVF